MSMSSKNGHDWDHFADKVHRRLQERPRAIMAQREPAEALTQAYVHYVEEDTVQNCHTENDQLYSDLNIKVLVTKTRVAQDSKSPCKVEALT